MGEGQGGKQPTVSADQDIVLQRSLKELKLISDRHKEKAVSWANLGHLQLKGIPKMFPFCH